MLHRNNKIVWAQVNGHNLHTDRNEPWFCGREQKNRSPQMFCLCIQQQLKYMLYWDNICDQHGWQWWLVSKQENMEEVD
jgi:hypothetical protein